MPFMDLTAYYSLLQDVKDSVVANLDAKISWKSNDEGCRRNKKNFFANSTCFSTYWI